MITKNEDSLTLLSHASCRHRHFSVGKQAFGAIIRPTATARTYVSENAQRIRGIKQIEQKGVSDYYSATFPIRMSASV